ncbi:NAD(P)-dependent dehydrogenase (short-subunit alcohol dehydrogenase family) [Spinactinospora alkalitolerans]|uniref:NAD(P)-dependent dehydrogenase (Short-subunit alcohol dehydrogenase family) n=1 Tax=Spinactinospora alkalitolerans TaxID=687207 RepID=A0A852TY57_9ACTN|nr:glucose 1-dehydrogenase [Spinactinospora alkalitolerans]NYE48207.1 NAD(P)-dependent dehydrogenase (short-subunit alcohol dehydrogenase family) [Spinactinospora alkalitolerans]
MRTPGRLAGKVALVTGAGSGLGRASALRFAEEGAAVACVDLDRAAADRVAEEIEGLGHPATALSADVSRAEDAERMTAGALARFGRIDVVFANAGVSGAGSAADTTEEDWDRIIGVNLKGVWLTSKYALPHMVERGRGVIINQASMGGLVGIAGIFPYTAAKGGVIAMTKQMAVEYGPANIRVNAICPGTIFTPLVARSRQERGADARSDAEANAAAALRFPLRRLGEVEDVAALALFLAGDEANWITGGVYTVDGGRAAM